jgi:uncharacterized protein
MRIVLIVLLAGALAAQTVPEFDKTDVMIPMRDGTKLHTEIYAPKNSTERLPLLITRTPYGPGADPQGFRLALNGVYAELAQEGFIFVSGYPGALQIGRPVRDDAAAALKERCAGD